MAMSGAACAQEMLTNLKAINPKIQGDQEAELLQYMEAMAGAIIDHIVQNAEVSVLGVTPGSGTATGEVE
jgi:hypothetical protein